MVEGFIENSLADIDISNGKLKGIDIKDDKISGKVLSFNDSYIEIDGYGKVPADSNFMIYDITQKRRNLIMVTPSSSIRKD